MSKEKTKTVANTVGANIVRQHFEGKAQKGITLIALIITIIIMLILVGVTVTVSLNGGLFTTAKQAEDETQIAQEKEQLLMAVMGALGEDGKVNLEKLDINLPEGFTGSNLQYTSKTGNVFKVSGNGSITLETDSNEDTGVTISPKKETYTVGEEVTIGDEHFYVIADDATKTTLLAKYNLNENGMQDAEEYGVPYCFSELYLVDLGTRAGEDFNNNDILKEDETSVVYKAIQYGNKFGVEYIKGRLMTYEEALELSESEDEEFLDKFYGVYPDNDADHHYIPQYWLSVQSSVLGTPTIYVVLDGERYR